MASLQWKIFSKTSYHIYIYIYLSSLSLSQNSNESTQLLISHRRLYFAQTPILGSPHFSAALTTIIPENRSHRREAPLQQTGSTSQERAYNSLGKHHCMRRIHRVYRAKVMHGHCMNAWSRFKRIQTNGQVSKILPMVQGLGQSLFPFSTRMYEFRYDCLTTGNRKGRRMKPAASKTHRVCLAPNLDTTWISIIAIYKHQEQHGGIEH